MLVYTSVFVSTLSSGTNLTNFYKTTCHTSLPSIVSFYAKTKNIFQIPVDNLVINFLGTHLVQRQPVARMSLISYQFCLCSNCQIAKVCIYFQVGMKYHLDSF